MKKIFLLITIVFSTIFLKGQGVLDLDPNKYISIGVTNPNSRLEIKGEIGQASCSPLNIRKSSDASALYIHANGNIGINTTNPASAKLVLTGGGSSAATIALSIQNSAFVPVFIVYDDGTFEYTSAHGSMSMQSSSSYTPSLTQDVAVKIEPTFTTKEIDAPLVRAGDSVLLPIGHFWVDIDGNFATSNNTDIEISCRVGNIAEWEVYRASGTGTSNYTPIGKKWYVVVTSSAKWLSFRATNKTNNDDPVFRDISVHINDKPEK